LLADSVVQALRKATVAPSREPTTEQLQQELRRLRARIAELEAAGADHGPRGPGQIAIQALLDASHDIAFLIDPAGGLLACNESFARRFGRVIPDLLNTDILDLLPADLARTRRGWIEEVVASGRAARFADEHAGRRFENTVHPVLDEEGRVARLAVFARDITEETRMQRILADQAEAIRLSERRLRAAFDTAATGMALVDAAGRWVWVNPALCDLTGYSEAELLAMDFQSLTHPDDLAADLDGLRGLVAGDITTHRIEKRYIHKNGHLVWVLLNVATLQTDADGRATQFICQITDMSARRTAEEALRRERDLVARIAASSPVGICLLDRHGVITFANGEAERILGLSRDEITQRAYNSPEWRITDFDGGPLPEEQLPFRQVLAAKRAVRDVRHAVQWPTGRRTLLSVNAAPLFDPSGEVDGVVVALEDVTERVQAEHALAQSEERFRSIVQSSPMGMHLYSLEADGRLVFRGANPAADAILRVDHSHFVGRTIEDVFPALAGTEVPQRYRRACAAGEPWQTEQIDYADERIRGAFEVHAFQTAPGAMAAIFVDITRRKQNEEALRRERDFSDTLVQASPAFFVAISSEGRVMMMNRAMLSALGYSRDEVVGRDYLSTFVPEADRPALGEVFNQLLRDRRPTINENRTLAKDGRELLVEWHGRPVLRRDGTLDYFFGVGIDLTERNRAAAEKTRLEVQLAQAQKMEAIGRLAGGVAHDFNNMLAAIQGYAELILRAQQPGDRFHGEVEEILKAGQRAAGLTQQLLAFSRKQMIAPQVLDLNGLVEDSARMLARLIGEDIVLEVAPGAGEARVKADPHQLEQVLVNLAVNARDAMPNGGRLTIRTSQLELDEERARTMNVEPGPYVVLAVGDTGGGMDDATRARIFEPFFTTKEPSRGTGLGLATVHGIVLQNHGQIEVFSAPGVGTTFLIYLPREEAPAREPGGLPETSTAVGTETILLVEDEALVRTLARTVLVSLGYDVLEANDGQDALRLCGSHPGAIHLLLTDVIMPSMNGRDLARQVLELRPGVKVLFMSGYTHDALAPHGVLEEGIELLEKPFTVEDLGRRVRAVLDR
jgi:two-component system, cell cycle sensor histidine kinase and response regulator CckA